MAETASGATTLAPDASSVTTINDGTVIERPEESSTGISRPSWLEDKGDDGKAEEGAKDKPAGEKKPDVEDKKDKPKDGDDTATVEKSATTGPDADGTKSDGEAEDQKEESKSAKGQHPKGYVPVAAVHEARAELKITKSELFEALGKITELEQKVTQKVETPKQVDDFAGFEVLSDDDLELLADEDPVAAANYAKKLVKYERHTAEQEANKGKQAEQEKHNKIQRQVAYDRIKEIVPDADTNKSMVQFVLDHGLSAEALFLTDPATMVVLPGTNTPVPLNQYAADLVSFLGNMQERVKGKDVGSLTIDDIPEELKAEIVADASDKILGKVKATNKPRSVGKIPSSNRDTGDRFAGRTYAELNEEERKAYLGG